MFKKGALFLLFVFLIFLSFHQKRIPPLREQLVLPTPTSAKIFKTVTYEEKTYAYDFFTVNDTNSLSLVLNKDRKRAVELIEGNSCETAINGGFYDADHEPLGLFISEGQVLKPGINSDLFNGYLTISKDGFFEIAGIVYDLDFKIALQTGPVFYREGNSVDLTIKNDKLARRMFAATTNDERLIFGTVFNPLHKFSGPYLTDLPLLLRMIADREKIELLDAINLDGGSASVFKSSNLFLEDLQTVGSLFCFR